MAHFVILGASGQLGQAFSELLAESGRSFQAFDERQVDFTDPASLEFSLAGVQAVINCAAYTNVDGAETDEKTATIVNGDTVGILAGRCHAAGIPLVHFSTDYVFDGQATTPYRLDHTHSPINAYGRSKALGETLLLASGVEHLLIRTSWVYAPWGNNFVLTMARLMKAKPELRVVDDQTGRPTHVHGLATRTLALLDGGHRGTFHIADGGLCTWFGFASAIARVLETECRLTPCTTDEFPRPAKRPNYSVLDTSRADELLGEPIPFEERLLQMKDVLLSV
jgi:dTDP-4-dehydrorhamnose reductase